MTIWALLSPQQSKACNRLHEYRRFSAQLVLNMRPQDVVETRIGDKADGLGPRGVEVSRPSGDNASDGLVGLLADQPDGLFAGDAAQRLYLLRDRRRQARCGDRAPLAQDR